MAVQKMSMMVGKTSMTTGGEVLSPHPLCLYMWPPARYGGGQRNCASN